jgi:hypothetical protein
MQFPVVNFDTRIRTPAGLVIVGASQVGKTRYISKLLLERRSVFDVQPKRIVYAYTEWQPEYLSLKERVPEIEFVNGVQEILEDGEYFHGNDPKLLVLDDMATAIVESKKGSKLFTQCIHHKNLTVLYVVNNLFKQGKSSRDIHLNSQYVFLFRNVRDVNQIKVLSNQMGIPYLQEAYGQATSEPYQPLMIDLRTDTPAYLRLRSHILPDEICQIYIDPLKTKLPKNVG